MSESTEVQEAYDAYLRATARAQVHREQLRQLDLLRELSIKAAHRHGESYRAIADRTGLSRSRVQQMVKK